MAGEKNFENKVKKWLVNQGIYEAGTPENKIVRPIKGWFYKVWGGGLQRRGIADLIINANGFFIGCEVKDETGKPSELQKKNISMINHGNGIGIILYPDGFEAFKNIVKGVIECKCHIHVLNALTSANESSKCVIWTD